MSRIFPDTYFHIGGDETDFKCWDEVDSITSYMRANNLTSKTLYRVFVDRLHAMMRKVAPDKTTVIWQVRG